ncbi:LOW QUALITY PROTEIN: mucin-12 [Embiotoca jacksoni]|uniref:LOW QUALITY PROTEIN: mucin-12 n=1 Tax=Embiotoca jacksoni TaxID=100190 RepID=UPI003703FC78
MEPPQRGQASPQLLAAVSQSVVQTPTNQAGDQSHRSTGLERDSWKLQQLGGHSLQLQLQDSGLSPALSLLPVNSGGEHNFTEYSLFQQSDTEFAPLRAYPDDSMASGRFRFPLQDRTTRVSERGSLSQHPLVQPTIVSEEAASSCCSLSQHSLSPGILHPPMTVTAEDRRGLRSPDETGDSKKPEETLKNQPVGEAGEDETFFLRKDVSARRLLELLQKDVGMPSSSSAVSSASDPSVKSTVSFTDEFKSSEVSAARREGAPAGAEAQQPDRVSNRSRALPSEARNVTSGSRSTQPDESSEQLQRELLSEAERRGGREDGAANRRGKSPTPPGQSLAKMSGGKPSATRTHPWTGPFSAGVERVHGEQELWSSGNQTGIDGSYLGFLPQSQSTPGVLNPPPKSSVQVKLGRLSAIESHQESSYQSSTEISPPQPAGADGQRREDAASAEVQSLPSLNYMQKVDAWRANQTSGKTSLFDSLALQGFFGVSPKTKAFDAVSDTLNRILSQQAVGHGVRQSSSAAPSGPSSPRRGEAAGSAPNDKDQTGSAAPASPSPLGRSQSHSSLSTVVTSVHRDQQTDNPPEKEKSQEDAHHPHHPGTAAQPSHPTSLGHFSDVSPDRDVTLSSSQDSYGGVKVGTSIGASSVLSLELDNYVPNWTSKLSTPPPLQKPRDLNIDERIPLYLHNLGIDQSPSTILTPFAPRGPIREPEFSPTDLCTIKGSIGTPTKSTQPSEGGSPHKGEFSTCSILSVDSAPSIPFSLDSLGPAVSVSVLVRARRTSAPSDTGPVHGERGPASFSEPEEDSYSSVVRPRQRQQDGSSTTSRDMDPLGDTSDVSLGVKTRSGDRNAESLLQTSSSVDPSAEDSFVSSKDLLETRRFLSPAEDVVSAGSSAASSASPAVRRPLSDEDIFLSLKKKTGTLRDSSISPSSAAEDTGTRPSPLWTGSSSDSALTSERSQQISVGRETSSWQPDYPSTQALFTAPAPPTVTHDVPQDGGVFSGAGASLVLSESVRRTEPEGCSAAPPDKVPTQPPLVRSLPAASAQQQLSSNPADTPGVPEEEEETTPGGPVQIASVSPVLEDSDQGGMSDGSSDGSLAVRVAKLLQSESPATVVSSTPSVTDHEESKAREWIKMKISGQQCEPLELDKEDRRRIEEIKRELLLKHPLTSQGSTDTESSAASSFKVQRENGRPRSVEMFSALGAAAAQPTQRPQGVGTRPPGAPTHTQNAPRSHLEAQVCEIAAREGVTLPTSNQRAFTSITIATRRRCAPPSPPASPLSPAPAPTPDPAPLHLTELSTAAADRQLPVNAEEEKEEEEEEEKEEDEDGVTLEMTTSAPGSQKREYTWADGLKTLLRPRGGSTRDAVALGSVSGDGRGAASTVRSPAGTGHVSRVRLNLSPKATGRAFAAAHANEFVALRCRQPAASSPDEGVGLSSPPEWSDAREATRRPAPERSDALAAFKTVGAPGRTNAATARRRPETSQRPFTAETPAVPVLLPYKPRGSDELFYVPQMEADVSSADGAMESSHPGSDDAVPPRFSSEVLGHQDPGLDRGVSIRHTEGIYSKRLKTGSFNTQQPGNGADRSRTPDPSAFTRVPPRGDQRVLKRDQGTSPVQFLQPGPRPERFLSARVEMEDVPRPRRDPDLRRPAPRQSGRTLDQLWQTFCDQLVAEEARPTREATLLERLERLSRLIHGTRAADVSRVWEEEDDPPEGTGRRGEVTPRRKEQEEVRRRREEVRRRSEEVTLRRKEWEEVRRREEVTLRRKEWEEVRRSEEGKESLGGEVRGGKNETKAAEDDRRASSSSSSSSCFPRSSSHSQRLCPAGRDESETLSTVSGSVSTVDTARLIRAFGAHRVQKLKSTSGLGKLYRTIQQQKEGRSRDPPNTVTPSQTPGTDPSVDSAASTSAYGVPSGRGSSGEAVKLVNKSVQAGDLEIVRNGTRRHTRDVGTTFPSPGEARALRRTSSPSSSVAGGGGGRGGGGGVLKQRKSKRSPSKPYPPGVSWFISADGPRSEARKENRPEESSSPARMPSSAWFQPHSGTGPWREPLGQRPVHEDRNAQSGFIHPVEPDPDPGPKRTSSGLVRVSLQEALETRRPEFISRSRQRTKLLALQAEERKLQVDVAEEREEREEREELFRGPGGPARPAGNAGNAHIFLHADANTSPGFSGRRKLVGETDVRLILRRVGGSDRLREFLLFSSLLFPVCEGTATLRRAVPRKEMIQRSKQIYENLPEVKRRREEERRRAEYRSYRLNARLFNKRITDRVLGRRSAWS